MSKFNAKEQVRNYEGEKAYALTAKQDLYTRVCTSLVSGNKYYENEDQTYLKMVHLIKEVSKKDPEFILKLAVYARNEMNMRTTPIILLGEAADIIKCKPYIREYMPAILRRADEPAELVSYWIKRHGSIGDQGDYPFPNSLKKGLSDVLNNLTEYEVNKYNRTNKLVTFKDIIRICHPKPKDEKQNSLFRYILHDEIDENLEQIQKINEFNMLEDFDTRATEIIEEVNITWEIAVSKFGNKKEVWDALNLPFMAMLRNLRNMLNCGADMDKAVKSFQDSDIIKNSKQFPFRFYSAYKSIEDSSSYETKKVMAALSQAIKHSIDNVPAFKGKTVIACDNSGSMHMRISSRSKISYKDIANMFGALIDATCEDSLVYSFGTEPVLLNLDPDSIIFDKMEKIESADTQGWSTNAYRVIEDLIEKGIYADRIIVLSDMQCYNSDIEFVEDEVDNMQSAEIDGIDYTAETMDYEIENLPESSIELFLLFCNESGLIGKSKSFAEEPKEKSKSFAEELREYKKNINPDVKIYSIDLAGYGTSIVEPGNLNLISGWSDRIIDLIRLNDEDITTAIEVIENTTSSLSS